MRRVLIKSAAVLLAAAISGAAAAETLTVRLSGGYERAELERLPTGGGQGAQAVASKFTGSVRLSLKGRTLEGDLSALALHTAEPRRVGARLFLQLDFSRAFAAPPGTELLFVDFQPRAFGPGDWLLNFQGGAELRGGLGRFRGAKGRLSLIFNADRMSWGNDRDAIELPAWRP